MRVCRNTQADRGSRMPVRVGRQVSCRSNEPRRTEKAGPIPASYDISTDMTAEPNLTRSGRRAFCVRFTRRNTDRRSGLAVVAAIGVALVATGCAPTQSGKGSIAERPTVQRPADPGVVAINGVRYVARTDRDSVQVGDATWYGPGF